MSSDVKLAHTMMTSLGFALIRNQRIEQILRIMRIRATAGRTGRTIMTNKDIEEMKRNIDELVEGLKKQEDENARLKATVKSQREKIDSLLKELEEERGKTITIGDGTISMRADMWDTVNENRKLKSENNELRKRLEKLESDICGTSPCIVSEFHLFEGESWIKASTYDDVLLRLKKANERITDLEQDIFNKSTDELKQAENLSSENKSLKDENKALKQRIKDLEDVCDGSCFSDEEDDRDKLIDELQDQHQQDCIRYNDMRTAYLVTLDELARLREQFGAGK